MTLQVGGQLHIDRSSSGRAVVRHPLVMMTLQFGIDPPNIFGFNIFNK